MKYLVSAGLIFLMLAFLGQFVKAVPDSSTLPPVPQFDENDENLPPIPISNEDAAADGSAGADAEGSSGGSIQAIGSGIKNIISGEGNKVYLAAIIGAIALLALIITTVVLLRKNKNSS